MTAKIPGVLMLVPALASAGAVDGHGLDWMTGCWATPDKTAQEVWVADERGALTGFSVVVGEKEVVFYEILSIRHDDQGSLVYIAHPAGQAHTSFTAEEITESAALFVNAEHDYPQEIRYKRESDQLVATISLLDGVNPTVFRKAACE